MLYATGLFLAFWLGTLISAVITSKLVKNQQQYENNTDVAWSSMYQDPESMSYKSKHPYDWEVDEKFFQTIKHFKKN